MANRPLFLLQIGIRRQNETVEPFSGYTVGMDSFFFALTLALSAIDLREHRLPNQLVYWLLVLAVIQDPGKALAAWPGLLVMGLIYLLSKGSLGWGDVKLFSALCAHVGLESVWSLLTLSFILAGVVSLICLIKNGTTKQVIPLGPFLCFSALVIR